MDSINVSFQTDGDINVQSDNSTFRKPEAINGIRKRSWAIHDGILGEPFTNVTMYKQVGKQAGLNTAPNCEW